MMNVLNSFFIQGLDLKEDIKREVEEARESNTAKNKNRYKGFQFRNSVGYVMQFQSTTCS